MDNHAAAAVLLGAACFMAHVVTTSSWPSLYTDCGVFPELGQVRRAVVHAYTTHPVVCTSRVSNPFYHISFLPCVHRVDGVAVVSLPSMFISACLFVLYETFLTGLFYTPFNHLFPRSLKPGSLSIRRCSCTACRPHHPLPHLSGALRIAVSFVAAR